MKLALFIFDGVGFRNFVLSSFLEQFAQIGEVETIHFLSDKDVEQYQHLEKKTISWKKGVAAHEDPVSYTLRYALAYAQMYWVRAKVLELREVDPIRGSWRTNLSQSVSKVIGQLAATPHGIQLLSRVHLRVAGRLPEVEFYKKMFLETQPAIVMSTKQWSPDAVHPVIAAKSMGIPTVTFIVSWDNLTTKGRIAAPFDHYLVWSVLMKDELLRYYPDVSPSQVHVVGTPQFDIYYDDSCLWTREDFFQRINGDPLRPLICYSSGIPRTCPEDQDHAMCLMKLIRDKEIKGNPQVILRPSPTDNLERYKELREKFPELIFSPPLWRSSKSGNSTDLPMAEDVEFLANLTHHADMNVNMASTMTLDFAIHDKPIVNIAFDIATPPPFRKDIWELYYQFEHYRPVVELSAARFARSPKELATYINQYLENPGLDHQARRKLVEMQIARPFGKAFQMTIAALEEIIQANEG